MLTIDSKHENRGGSGYRALDGINWIGGICR